MASFDGRLRRRLLDPAATLGVQQGLKERRWIEGLNIRIEYRWAAGEARDEIN
jgi:hypothetical protein